MIIQHNISAINSYRQLSGNNSALAKNLEKLSSGYKVNRAGDDAAGLAISEKMRAQIRGLETAQKNANDGISLIQTAEGALTEVHSMLNRMVELATQAANGIYGTEERENLQMEIKSLNDEIDRIAANTDFNGIKLLDGSLGNGAPAAAPAAAPTASGTIGGAAATTGDVAATAGKLAQADFTASDAFNSGSVASVEVTIQYVNEQGETKDVVLDVATGANDGVAFAENLADKINNHADLKDIFKATHNAGTLDIETVAKGSSKIEIKSLVTDGANGGDDVTVNTFTKGADAGTKITANEVNADDELVIGGKTYKITADTEGDVSYDGDVVKIGIGGGSDYDLTSGDAFDSLKAELEKNGITVEADGNDLVFRNKVDDSAVAGAGLTLQVGDTAEQTITVSVNAMDSESLGVGGNAATKVDLSSVATSNAAIANIKTAISSVSKERANLGALQNRLEHTINNLGVTTENITAAESRIRDTDMAKEMMEYTKNNILVQSAQAMLAQANMVPQGVLQLLR